MIHPVVEALLSSQSDDALNAFLESGAVFHVDHREEDELIAGYCERVLSTGDLASELVDIDDDPGFELELSHGGRTLKAGLRGDPGDRHLTILALNRVLHPQYEIRVCVDTKVTDTLAFLALTTQEWAALEARFKDAVSRRFRKVEVSPNLFTDEW
jgi:hypothetical protein